MLMGWCRLNQRLKTQIQRTQRLKTQRLKTQRLRTQRIVMLIWMHFWMPVSQMQRTQMLRGQKQRTQMLRGQMQRTQMLRGQMQRTQMLRSQVGARPAVALCCLKDARAGLLLLTGSQYPSLINVCGPAGGLAKMMH